MTRLRRFPRVLAPRVLLSLAPVFLSCWLPTPASAEAGPRLRGDVTARADVLTLGDLVENAPEPLRARPLFRAPALGAVGTIQVRRIAEVVERLAPLALDTGGRVQVQVSRAARRVGPAEIEAAVRRALGAQGLDPDGLVVRLDGEPTLLAPPDLDGPARALEVVHEPRAHRFAGLVVLGERQASLRVTGTVSETRPVAVLTRALGRGEPVGAGDLGLERRPREAVQADALGSLGDLFGQVAQHPLGAGAVLRRPDLAPPDLVERGKPVAVVFETAGVTLTLTGLANESGRLGASVPVLNPASKKILQGVVVGPGRVSVGPPRVARPVLSASAEPRAAE